MKDIFKLKVTPLRGYFRLELLMVDTVCHVNTGARHNRSENININTM